MDIADLFQQQATWDCFQVACSNLLFLFSFNPTEGNILFSLYEFLCIFIGYIYMSDSKNHSTYYQQDMS